MAWCVIRRPFDRDRPDFDRPHPARLGDARRRHALVPRVLRHRRHGERMRLDDQVRFLLPEAGREIPALILGPRPRRRHVLRIAFRRAVVHPADDGVDLRVGQRPIVLELLDADRLVDVPRRHLPVGDAGADRACPRPRLGVGLERHRRDRIGAVAGLALGLEDRRDVPGEGRRRWRVLAAPARPGERQDRRRRRRTTTHRPQLVRMQCRSMAMSVLIERSL